MNNDEYDYGHNVSNYHSDGEGDLEEIINATSTDMKVRIKKLCPEAKIPEYAHPGDAGMDLYATSIAIDEMCNTVYGTGIAVEDMSAWYSHARQMQRRRSGLPIT